VRPNARCKGRETRLLRRLRTPAQTRKITGKGAASARISQCGTRKRAMPSSCTPASASRLPNHTSRHAGQGRNGEPIPSGGCLECPSQTCAQSRGRASCHPRHTQSTPTASATAASKRASALRNISGIPGRQRP
jgi:hypothetical protein